MSVSLRRYMLAQLQGSTRALLLRELLPRMPKPDEVATAAVIAADLVRCGALVLNPQTDRYRLGPRAAVRRALVAQSPAEAAALRPNVREARAHASA